MKREWTRSHKLRSIDGAVARSAEAFGITQIMLVNPHRDRFKKARSRTAAGADKWITYTHFRSTAECFDHLRDIGYHISVAHCAVYQSLTPQHAV
eukprot:m.492168 g.492168  ORF g.492168 m.492168 type:complete len:95 (+) comp21784_c0_seq72:2540-2824(+)